MDDNRGFLWMLDTKKVDVLLVFFGVLSLTGRYFMPLMTITMRWPLAGLTGSPGSDGKGPAPPEGTVAAAWCDEERRMVKNFEIFKNF